MSVSIKSKSYRCELNVQTVYTTKKIILFVPCLCFYFFFFCFCSSLVPFVLVYSKNIIVRCSTFAMCSGIRLRFSSRFFCTQYITLHQLNSFAIVTFKSFRFTLTRVCLLILLMSSVLLRSFYAYQNHSFHPNTHTHNADGIT